MGGPLAGDPSAPWPKETGLDQPPTLARRARTLAGVRQEDAAGARPLATDQAINAHIGRQLRRRRKLSGLTQSQLAAACGVRFQQIQKYECGANTLSVSRLWRLTQILGVTVSYFFEGLAGPGSS